MLIGTYNAKYIGKSMCGFVNGHEYSIEIEKDIYGYIISGIVNITEDKGATSACMNYASERSILKNWSFEDAK